MNLIKYSLLFVSFILISCKPRSFNSGSESKSNSPQIVLPTGEKNGQITSNGERIDVTWPCTGSRGISALNNNPQEEYCEWNRAVVNMGQPLKCVFRASFDYSRKYYLTQRAINRDNPDGASDIAPFAGTYQNSFAFLVGGKDKKSDGTIVGRTGLVPHCMKNSCEAPNCVDSRASDPNLCKVINVLSGAGCQVDYVRNDPPMIPGNLEYIRNKVSNNEFVVGDTNFKLQLAMSSKAQALGCQFKSDPKLIEGFGEEAPVDNTLVECNIKRAPNNVRSCDAIAGEISVIARLRITNPQQCFVLSPQNNESGH